MKKISIILPYYENPNMFKEQQRGWKEWSPMLKEHTEIIVIDDCSPEHKAVLFTDLQIASGREGLNFRLYQLLENVPWNWIACRNIGAHHARGEWLLMTDIDHIVTPELLIHLHTMPVEPDHFYVPSRVDGPERKPNPKPHPNSYFMSKEFFWGVGGYDEFYSGVYGTDGIWRRRCEAVGKRVFLDQPLVQYLPTHIADCRSSLPRKSDEQRAEVLARTAQKAEQKALGQDTIKVLSFPYERVL